MHINGTLLAFLYINSQHALQAPSQVTGVSLYKAVQAESAALAVNWTAPQSVVNISDYQVQYRRNGTTSWNSTYTNSSSPLSTSTILTGLDAGTEYNVRVRAVSAVRNGMWSIVQTERTFDGEFIRSSPYSPCMLLLCNHGQ